MNIIINIYIFSYFVHRMRRIRKVFTCLVLVSGVSVFFFFLASEKERVKGKNIVHLKGILIVVVIFVWGGGGGWEELE